MNKDNQEKAALVVSKILRDTLEEKIQWSTYPSRSKIDLLKNETLHGDVFCVMLENRCLRIYCYETPVNTSFIVNATEKWELKYRLEFFNNESGISEWSFPNTNSIYDLYETIKIKISKVEDFFDSFLK